MKKNTEKAKQNAKISRLVNIFILFAGIRLVLSIKSYNNLNKKCFMDDLKVDDLKLFIFISNFNVSFKSSSKKLCFNASSVKVVRYGGILGKIFRKSFLAQISWFIKNIHMFNMAC